MGIVRGNVPTPVGANSGNNLSPTKPTGLANGDTLIVELTLGANSPPTPPTGWTQFVFVNFANVVVKWGFYHVVADVSLEPASYPFTWATLTRATGIIVPYSGVDITNPMDVAIPATAGASSGATLAVGGITTVTDGAVLLSGAGQDSAGTGTATPPGSMSAVASAPLAGKCATLADEADPTAGPTGTRTWSFSSSTLAHAAWLAALRPAAGPIAGTMRPAARITATAGRRARSSATATAPPGAAVQASGPTRAAATMTGG
jgi:hypothetical protein